MNELKSNHQESNSRTFDRLEKIKKSISEIEAKLEKLDENDPKFNFYINMLEIQCAALDAIKNADHALVRSDKVRSMIGAQNRNTKRTEKVFYWFMGCLIIIGLLLKLFYST